MADATPLPRAPEADLWNQAGDGLWHLDSWPGSLSDLWSEEKPTLYVSKDADGYWLSRPGIAGQSRHATLEEAKKAGDAAAADAERRMEGHLLADAGLDPAAWAFEFVDGARFTLRDDPSARIEIDIDGSRPKPLYTALAGGDEVGGYADPAEAAAVLVDRPAPGP